MSARWTLLPGSAGAFKIAENVTVIVQGSRITDVLRGRPGAGVRHIEVPQGILFPGFVNLHNHSLNGPIFRGLVDDIGPQTQADGLVYSVLLPLGDLAGQVLSEDEIKAVYRLAVVELLRSGTTTVLDMPRAVHSAFFAVAKKMGLRVFGAPYIFSTPTRGVDALGDPIYHAIDQDRSLKDALTIADEYDDGPGGLIRIGFGPHATDTCSPGLLRRIAREVRERSTFASIHVAQSRLEVQAVKRRHGVTPVELLRLTGLLGPDLIAAHCVYAEDQDLDLLRDSGTTVANCPLTFARSGVTVSFDRFHRHGVRTGIGTDAYNFDHFAEMRAAGFISKLSSGDSGAADAATLLRAATETGAAALSRPDLGRIEPGRTADLVVVDLGAAPLQPVRDPLRNLVWNATPGDVSLVLVDGDIVVRDGRPVRCDEAGVVRDATAAVERLWEAAERAGVLAVRGRDGRS
ncbi:amidohydrolase family protein [Actinomadura madurae]|uniref:amidohydrolase family protein n=1 Tax=Actinomadura madurae TaxID=1993 RepID=UPI0020270DA5|nr:amidohydrolase family protein [Actinomadura madurae]URM96452.1 amidohydrolase family protein [Actinomadura madurae]